MLGASRRDEMATAGKSLYFGNARGDNREHQNAKLNFRLMSGLRNQSRELARGMTIIGRRLSESPPHLPLHASLSGGPARGG